MKPSEKARNTGISLPPRLIEQARTVAKEEGYGTLSALVRKLLTDYLRDNKRAKH